MLNPKAKPQTRPQANQYLPTRLSMEIVYHILAGNRGAETSNDGRRQMPEYSIAPLNHHELLWGVGGRFLKSGFRQDLRNPCRIGSRV